MRLDDYLHRHPEIRSLSEAKIRVKVVKPICVYSKGSYRGKYIGYYGTVEREKAGVRLDLEENPASGYGLFWFQQDELEVIEDECIKEENKMAINGNYKVAVVKYVDGFNTNKEYNFALFPEDEMAYKNNPDATHFLVKDSNGYHVVVPVKVVDKNESTHAVTQEIICAVNFGNYDKRVADRAKKKKLKAEMDALVKQNQELVVFQMLAEKNPEMAELLKEYKALSDV